MLLMVTTRQTEPVCEVAARRQLPSAGELEKFTEGKIFEEQKQRSSCSPPATAFASMQEGGQAARDKRQFIPAESVEYG